MTSFRRAHSAEQRAVRKQTILDTAAAMLAEMPVAQISLNELSRRVGLAKSNVLRYFESREAVLLELLTAESRDWLDQLDGTLAAAVDGSAAAGDRGDQLAAALADSLTAHPVLCDLISAQAAVLEHNISPQVAATFKRSAIDSVSELAQLTHKYLPELGEHDAGRFGGVTIMVTGALWTYSQPAAAMLTAYETDPSLAALRLDFTATLRETLEMLLAGLLTRSSR